MKKWTLLFLIFWGHSAVTGLANVNFPIETAHVSEIVFRGGSFWEGYSYCQIKIPEQMLTARWDIRTMERTETREGSKKLLNEEIQALLQSLSALDREVWIEECGIAADGPEESLTLSFDNTDSKLTIVNQRSRMFVCGDIYVTNESFDGFLDTLKGIFPALFAAEEPVGPIELEPIEE